MFSLVDQGALKKAKEHYAAFSKSENFFSTQSGRKKEDYIKENYMMALLKNKTLVLLLELTSGPRKLTEDAYFKFKVALDPNVFRNILVYQHHFFLRYHPRSYKMNLLYRFETSVDRIKDSCYVLEQGHMMYFLLMKIKHEFSFSESNKHYDNTILSLIPEKVRTDVQTSNNIFLQLFQFIYEIYMFFHQKFNRPSPPSLQVIEKKCKDENKIEKYMKFYTKTCSHVDILIDGQLITYQFVVLPY